MRWLGGVTDSMNLSVSKLQETLRTGRPGVPQSMGSQRVRHNSATELKSEEEYVESSKNSTERPCQN